MFFKASTCAMPQTLSGLSELSFLVTLQYFAAFRYVGMLQLDGSGFNHQISRGVQGWDHAKITHLMARDGHSREAPLALTHEVMSWNISIVNPTGIGSPGDVSNALGIFSGGTRGTSTNMDVPRQFHHQLITRRQAEATLTHTDAWADSRCHHSSPGSKS